MAYKTANPALNEKTFDQSQSGAVAGPPMTLQGTVNKSFILLGVTIAGASYSWTTLAHAHDQSGVMGMAGVALLIGFVLAMIIIFKKTTAPYLSWFYAAFEGVALGAISCAYEAKFPGIVMNSVGLTFGTMFAMLAAYTSQLIKPTERFKLGVVAATGGIMVIYIVDLIARFAFHISVPLISDNGILGICFSAFIVIIAALNLVLDFDFIENGVKAQAPKYMEWYASFGLLVTLVWLYLEILRMLGKARSR